MFRYFAPSHWCGAVFMKLSILCISAPVIALAMAVE
jgi:hypothetical protein